MKKNLKPLIISALTAIAMGGIGVGTTFALFTDKAETSISVKAGIVDVDQQIVITSKTSALADDNGTMVDENGAHYTTQTGWVNGGDAEVLSNGNLSLHEMTPGDRVDFKVQMKNKSNVNVKYRFVLGVLDTSDLLASGLQITLGSETYNGLLSYSSDWTLLEPVQTPEFTDLITGSIFLPMDRGNVFQKLSTTYNLAIQVVQGNAATSSGASYEEASYLPQAQVLDENKKATVKYAESTPAETTVQLDFSDNTSYSAGQEIVLGVNTVDVVENSSSFVVATEGNSAAAAIDLSLYIDGTQVTKDFVAKITTTVASGLDLDSIKIEYLSTDTSVAFANGGTRVENLADVDEVGEFYYDATNGSLTFMTDHFSEYVVTASNIVAYNKTNKISYTSLQGAINSATAGDTIVLLKDIVNTNGGNTTPEVDVNKSIILDGQNHLIKSNNGRTVWVSKSNVNVTIRNLRTENTNQNGEGNYPRGIQVNTGKTNVNLSIENCNVSTKYYAINICSETTIELNLKDTVLNGWAGLNIWSNGVTVDAHNTTFNCESIANNRFAAIVLEADTTGTQPMHASDMVVDLYDCTFNCGEYVWQSVIGFNNNDSTGTMNNIVNMYRCNINKTGVYASGQEDDVVYYFTLISYDFGTDNELSIDEATKINGHELECLQYNNYLIGVL